MDTIRIYVYRCFFIIAFLLVNIGFVNSATVPEYYSYNFDVSEGLSSNTVFKILKWRDFVWVATRQGVDMYNGYSFKHYNLLMMIYALFEMVRKYLFIQMEEIICGHIQIVVKYIYMIQKTIVLSFFVILRIFI